MELLLQFLTRASQERTEGRHLQVPDSEIQVMFTEGWPQRRPATSLMCCESRPTQMSIERRIPGSLFLFIQTDRSKSAKTLRRKIP